MRFQDLRAKKLRVNTLINLTLGVAFVVGGQEDGSAAEVYSPEGKCQHSLARYKVHCNDCFADDLRFEVFWVIFFMALE